MEVLSCYLREINAVFLDEKEQLMFISFAIEADNRIEYAEVKFFKKIRSRLTISDEAMLAEHPGKENFLLPDINVIEIPIGTNQYATCWTIVYTNSYKQLKGDIQ